MTAVFGGQDSKQRKSSKRGTGLDFRTAKSRFRKAARERTTVWDA